MFPQQTKFQAFSLSNVIHQPTHVNILYGKYFVISLIMNYLVLFKGYILLCNQQFHKIQNK